MTTQEKAIKIATELYNGATKEEIKEKYNLTDKQYLGMLLTVMN